jgi:hypothetical protein
LLLFSKNCGIKNSILLGTRLLTFFGGRPQLTVALVVELFGVGRAAMLKDKSFIE